MCPKLGTPEHQLLRESQRHGNAPSNEELPETPIRRNGQHQSIRSDPDGSQLPHPPPRVQRRTPQSRTTPYDIRLRQRHLGRGQGSPFQQRIHPARVSQTRFNSGDGDTNVRRWLLPGDKYVRHSSLLTFAIPSTNLSQRSHPAQVFLRLADDRR